MTVKRVPQITRLFKQHISARRNLSLFIMSVSSCQTFAFASPIAISMSCFLTFTLSLTLSLSPIVCKRYLYLLCLYPLLKGYLRPRIQDSFTSSCFMLLKSCPSYITQSQNVYFIPVKRSYDIAFFTLVNSLSISKTCSVFHIEAIYGRNKKVFAVIGCLFLEICISRLCILMNK